MSKDLCYMNYAEDKSWYLGIEIMRLLKQHNSTYHETEEALNLVSSTISEMRNEAEYDNVWDYMSKTKNYNCSNDIIPITARHHIFDKTTFTRGIDVPLEELDDASLKFHMDAVRAFSHPK